MEKLNRLVWAAGLSFNVFGVRIGVRVSTQELLQRVIARLPAGWIPEKSKKVDRLYSVIGGNEGLRSSVRPFSFLYGEAQQLARSLSLENLYEALEADIDVYLAQASSQRLFVHAGVVAWDGGAIVIPGRSQSGKTTLVRAFLDAGAIYYSDEYAVFDAYGRVYPFPRALSIRGENNQPSRVSAERLGSSTGSKPLPVCLVALTSYQAGAHWKPRVLSPGRGVLGLLVNTPVARKEPQRTLATLGKLAKRVPVLESTRGEASETVASILRIMENKTCSFEPATNCFQGEMENDKKAQLVIRAEA
jgi:hypothetical protein